LGGYNSYNSKVTQHYTSSFHQSDAFHGTQTLDDTLTTKNSLIQTNFYLMYLINSRSSVKCYLKAGISYNFSVNTDNSLNESYYGTTETVTNGNPPVAGSVQNSAPIIELKKSYLVPLFGVGMIYGRNTLEFSYWLPADIGGEPIGIQGSPSQAFKISSMSLSYYFSVFRTK
jgi:hypothetical protein